MPGCGSDPAASFVPQANETRTIAAAPAMTTSEEAAAIQSAGVASHGTEIQGAIALWHAIDLDVSAVIGPRGTAAVLRPVLAMTRRTHGWLPELPHDAGFDVCVRALSDALDDGGTEASAAARQAVQVAFRDLLASLVGAALAKQLLKAASAARQARGEPAS
jgi:hypothetical protein